MKSVHSGLPEPGVAGNGLNGGSWETRIVPEAFGQVPESVSAHWRIPVRPNEQLQDCVFAVSGNYSYKYY